MIQKERLKELNKDVSIYAKYYDGIAEFTKNEITEITENAVYTYDFGVFGLCHLFETEEDAEFALLYQNITRTETLSLPIFDEFIDKYRTFGENIILDEKCVMFSANLKTYSLYADNDLIWIGCENDGSVIFKKPLTKENYLKACEVARKLFFGEKVEE